MTKKRKIVVIDDDGVTRKRICYTLESNGFEVAEASEGKAGVELVYAEHPDLVVCDVMMPEMDGFAVVDTLRSDPRTTLIPFIFLTSKAEAMSMRKGMDLGADDYLTKPLQPELLLNSIERRLKRRHDQLEWGRRQKEETSLALAATIPQEISDVIDSINSLSNLLSVKFESVMPEVNSVRDALQRDAERLRRMIRRLNFHAQLPSLYAMRFDQKVAETDSTENAGAFVGEVAGAIADYWKRGKDLEVSVSVDSIQMRDTCLQVLIEELVENGAKFSPAGSKIAVQIVPKSVFTSISVCNENSSLPEEQLKEIESFKQLWAGRDKPHGLGLGLSLVQGIVRLYGGEIEIQTNAAGQLSVEIMLPPVE